MRSTLTRTVLVILADTTVPSRRLILSRIGYLLVRRGHTARLLAEPSHDERQVAARAPIAGVIIQLIGAQLEPQPENFLARLALLDAQIRRGHLPSFIKLQGRPPRAGSYLFLSAACAPPGASLLLRWRNRRLPSRTESCRA